MELLAFHKLRAAIQGNAFPGSGRDLASMEENLQGILMASGLFDTVEVGQTDDPDQLLIALCEFKPEHSGLDVAEVVEQLWHERVRYPFWEAHSLSVDTEHVELQAATRTSGSGHYVTVHMVAQRAQVPAQRVPSD